MPDTGESPRSARSSWLRGWFRVVGCVLLIPAVLGLWLAWAWHDAARDKYPTLSPEAAVELRRQLERLEVPEPILRIAVMPKHRQIDSRLVDSLNAEQQEAIKTRIQFYRPSNFDGWKPAVVSEGLAPWVLGLSLVLGGIASLFLNCSRTTAAGHGAACPNCAEGAIQQARVFRLLGGLVVLGYILVLLGVIGVLFGASVVLGRAVYHWDFYTHLQLAGIDGIGIYLLGTFLLVVGAVLSDRRRVLQCTNCGCGWVSH